MSIVLAIDAGTTGVRTFAVDGSGAPLHHAYGEITQHFPRPGWVEHDADEILRVTTSTLADVVAWAGERGETIAAIGITNQRETVVAWSRASGRPLHRAIVWQDRRTAARCDELREAGAEPTVRATTGLVLDPYFSATKMEWLLSSGGVAASDDLALGTIDSWLAWHLTGGPDGGAFVTEPSNASRTMLCDLRSCTWSEELCALLGVPARALAEIRPSSGRFGITAPHAAAGLAVPLSGIAGDQQAALFGQACFEPGMAKNTYGTGSFVLLNVGTALPAPAEGLLTTVAWDLGSGPVYAMEGAIFVTGAAVQWLRDGLGIITEAAETGPLAAAVEDSGGVYLVPAFTGLGSPWWDPYARGAIVGITRGTTRAHIARAVVEAMAHQTRDVVDAITRASGTPPAELRVDGGASVMDLLCQLQADLLGVVVRRPRVQETTTLGAAYLAGLAEGVWDSPADAAAAWHEEASFTPQMAEDEREQRHATWLRAVERSRGWATDADVG
jgi:glycerol kinase